MADETQTVATNRRAQRNYDITDTYEAGIVLKGSEVKSLRESKVTLADAFGRVEGNEIYLIGLHIGAYSSASDQGGHELERKRKLLLHRREIDKIKIKADHEQQSIVPLRLYFKGGRAKVEIGIGRGRKTIDKRRVIAERDADLEARRAMSRRR
jgi:SsrA-binding protein